MLLQNCAFAPTSTRPNWDGRIVEIAVIPYTYQHTNLSDRVVGDAVNLEADVLGKYIERYLEAREKNFGSTRKS